MKIFVFGILLLASLVFLMPSTNIEASENVTLITDILNDNVTVTLTTHILYNDDDHHNYWGGCGGCEDDFEDIQQTTSLDWLRLFPNMITGIINPESTCSNLIITIMGIEPTAVIVGSPVNVVFVAESSCYYMGNVSLLLDNNANQNVGIDLTGVRNRTYRATILTGGLQPGEHRVTISGSSVTFALVSNVIATTIEQPVVQSVPITPVEKTQDKIIMWVAIAVGAIILVTVILLIILR